MNNLIIGSHVSFKSDDQLIGSVKEALSYGANTFMFYTGAPQNSARKPVEQLRIEEAKKLAKERICKKITDVFGTSLQIFSAIL